MPLIPFVPLGVIGKRESFGLSVKLPPAESIRAAESDVPEADVDEPLREVDALAIPVLFPPSPAVPAVVRLHPEIAQAKSAIIAAEVVREIVLAMCCLRPSSASDHREPQTPRLALCRSTPLAKACPLRRS